MMLTFIRNIMNITLVCSITTLCVAMAGCSSSGSLETQLDGLTQSPQPPVYAESNQDNLPSLLKDGEIIFSPLSAALHRDVDGMDAGVAQPASGAAYLKAIGGDGAGGLQATYVIDGKETPVHFAAETRNQGPRYPGITHYFLVRTAPDTFQYFWPWTRTVNGEPEFDYLDLYGWSIGWPGTDLSGLSAFGLRTPAQGLPLGSVTYEGRMRAELWDADKPGWSNQKSLQGTLNLEANLDDRQIAGRIDGLRMGPVFGDDASHEPLAGKNWIDIPGAMIGEEGRFTTQWVGHGPDNNAANRQTMEGFTGTVIGDFYGPAGEEVGGVLSGRRGATDTAPEQFLIGGFGASQNDE